MKPSAHIGVAPTEQSRPRCQKNSQKGAHVKWGNFDGGKHAKGKLDLKKKKGAMWMSQASNDAMRSMFSEYRIRLSTMADDNDDDEADGASLAPRGKQNQGMNMSRDGVRKLLGDSVNEQLFEFLFHLFDATGNGLVNSDEFVMTMGLLTGDECSTMDQQVEAVFIMFDTDAAGALTASEFRALIQATINFNLSSLLGTEQGRALFEETLEKEYSEENLVFWKAST